MFTTLFVFTILLLDTFVASTLWVAYQNNAPKRKRLLQIHLVLSVFFIVLLFVYRYAIDRSEISLTVRQAMALCFMWLYFTKLWIGILFWIAFAISKSRLRKPKPKPITNAKTPEKTISRAQFLERITLATGGVSLGLGLLGTQYNLYDYQIHHIVIKLPCLPKALRGLKIAQISDIHAGSLTNRLAVKGGFEMLMREKPDLICFTGDLVNYDTTEIQGFGPLFTSLKAPLGVFSCLGNHDYGDYKGWSSLQAKRKNLDMLIEAQRKFGWQLLIDKHTYIEAQGEKIALIGVGNWSNIGKFPRYGKLATAQAGIDEQVSTHILLSHDPTHWDAQVRTQTPKTSLMLAGHTHGMQMGIEWGNFRFSPAQLVFDQWAGLYQKGEQYLYVNRGFGYSDAFPLRLGILPEITVFTLT